MIVGDLKILMGPQVPRIPAVNTGVYATLRDVVTLKLLRNNLLALKYLPFAVSIMARKKWYAVIVGRAVGVFTSW